MTDLKKLISRGESETREFKKSAADMKAIIKTIAAFSNSRGGKIIIGVSDSGKVSGVKIGRDTVENITNQILQNTDPKVHPRISVEKISGKKRNCYSGKRIARSFDVGLWQTLQESGEING